MRLCDGHRESEGSELHGTESKIFDGCQGTGFTPHNDIVEPR
jgi:hypothetical protein